MSCAAPFGPFSRGERVNRNLALVAVAAGCALGTACGSDSAGGPEQPTPEQFAATLSAANVVGATISSPGTGSASFVWNGTRLDFTITVQNMTEIIMAHIHGPASAAQNAAIIVDLFIPSNPTGPVDGQLASGAVVAGSHLLVGGVALAEVLGLLRTGQAYVLVHTVTNPDGEIRGQVQ
jgi:hypothetical protein